MLGVDAINRTYVRRVGDPPDGPCANRCLWTLRAATMSANWLNQADSEYPATATRIARDPLARWWSATDWWFRKGRCPLRAREASPVGWCPPTDPLTLEKACTRRLIYLTSDRVCVALWTLLMSDAPRARGGHRVWMYTSPPMARARVDGYAAMGTPAAGRV
jgi:hypothetical protein